MSQRGEITGEEAEPGRPVRVPQEEATRDEVLPGPRPRPCPQALDLPDPSKVPGGGGGGGSTREIVVPDPWGRRLMVLATLHFLVFAVLGLGRLWGGKTCLYDAGFWNQAIWRVSSGQGGVLEALTVGPHFAPFLVLFVPLHWLVPAPEWLFIAQPLLLALAVWPLDRTCRLLGAEPPVSFLWGVAYLFNPLLIAAEGWDFQPNAPAALFMAGSAWACVARRDRYLIVFLLGLLSCKEQYTLAVAGFGAFWVLRYREWRHGILLMGTGLGVAALLLAVFWPHTGSDLHPHMGRYGWLLVWLSQPAQEFVRTLIQMLIAPGLLFYGLLVLGPLAFLPLASPSFLLPAVPNLLMNALSINPMPRSPFAYHSVSSVPLLILAACAGSKLRPHRSPRAHAFLAALLSLASGCLVAPVPLPVSANFWEPRRIFDMPDPRVAEVLSVVGPTAPVSAQLNIGVHLSQRSALLGFPRVDPETRVVVLHLDNPRRKGAWRETVFNQPYGVHPRDYIKAVRALLSDREFGIVYWEDPWLVMERSHGDRVPRSAVLRALDRLESRS